MIKNMIDVYKKLEDKYKCPVVGGEHESFKRILKMQLTSNGYKFYSPNKTASSMCYMLPTLFQIMTET